MLPVYLMTFGFGILGNFSLVLLSNVVAVSCICFNGTINTLNYIYKLVFQIIERELITYFVYYMNMDITYSQEYDTKYALAIIYNLGAFPQF